tara:strand:+ start:217 stop:486 length:270 start_codon:yes stop_codon:yes gene_type:complete
LNELIQEEFGIVRKAILHVVCELFDSERLKTMDEQRKLNEVKLSDEEVALVSTVVEDEFDIVLPLQFLDNVTSLYDIIHFVQRSVCSSR